MIQLPYTINGKQVRMDDEAAVQKREWMYLLSKYFYFSSVLELYGGIGYSSYFYAQCTNKLDIVKKDEKKCECLKSNLQYLGLYHSGITIHNMDNKAFMAKCDRTYDYVDIDPHGSPRPILNNYKISSPYISITSGEILMVQRNLPNGKKYSKNPKSYIGKKVWKWCEHEFIPYINTLFPKHTVIAWYSYQTSVRVFLSQKKVVNEFIRKIKKYPQYLGSHRTYYKRSTQNKLF